MSVDRDIQFLYEIGNLRLMDRQWRRFLNTDSANLSEHLYRVTWTAIIIAKHENADIDKVIKMALVHDITESRTGDVDYISRQYTDRNEALAIKDMSKSTALGDEFVKIWQEYEKLESLEAKVVKDADNLDIDMEIQEQKARGSALSKDWKAFREQIHKNKLYTKSAKKFAKAIWSSNPHDWHLKGRNRINAGDWKVEP